MTTLQDKQKEEKRQQLVNYIDTIYNKLATLNHRSTDWLYWEAQRIEAMRRYYELFPSFM